jgi:hypothetical protein
MSKFRFTDGPWSIKHEFNIFSGERHICSAGGHQCNINPVKNDKENIANALLISCSTEILDALIMAVRDTCEDCINLRIDGEIGYGCVGMTDPNCSSVRGYKALIEKATGMTMDEVLK